MFELVLERAAEKELGRLSDEVHERVIKAISTLASNPRPPGSKKLSGTKSDWRIRVGDYRVLYEIADAVRISRPAPPRRLSLKVVQGAEVYAKA